MKSKRASPAHSNASGDVASNDDGSNHSEAEAQSNASEPASPRSEADERGSIRNASDDEASDGGGNASDGGGNASDGGGNASDGGGNASDGGGNASDGGGNASDGGNESDGVNASDDEEKSERAASSYGNESDRERSSQHEDDARSEDERSNRSDGEEHESSDNNAGSDEEQSEGRRSPTDDVKSDGAKSDSDEGAKSDVEEGAKSDAEEVQSGSEVEDDRERKSPRSNRGSESEHSDQEERKSGDDARASESEDEKAKQVASDDENSRPASEASASGGESPKKKRDATSDEEGDEEKKAMAEDLFGDADDISDEGGNDDKEDNENKELDHDKQDERDENDERGSPGAEVVNDDMEDGDKDEEVVPEEIPETRIDVEIPKITADLGKDLHFVKLPNFLSVETRPFDHATYEDEVDEDEVLDEEGRARLKLKVENTIRWRWGFDKEGNPVKQSNARIIKWSDGSMSLHLGVEIFDIHKQILQRDHNHLFIRQGTGLQGQAVFRTKLTFRPHSTDSFTHRKITISVADRSQKIQKIRVLPNVGKDPEAHRTEMIKKEEDRLKASIRRESKQRRMKERAQSRGLSSSYLEPDRYDDDDDDDDEGAISLAAIKNKFKKGADNKMSIYSSDSDASDIESHRSRRLEKAKAIADSDDEEAQSDESGPKRKIARIEESEDEDDE